MSSDLVIAQPKPPAALTHWKPCQISPAASRNAGRADGRRSAVRLLVLLVLAVQRRAEDVAEAGAGIGRAVFRHRLLVLLDLARLDRQRSFAPAAIETGEFGVDLFADGEAVGPLLGAVARQLGLADKALHVASKRDLDAAVGDGRDRAGHDVAFLDASGFRGRRRLGLKLLDAERDALFLDVDVEHAHLRHVALLVILDRLFTRLLPVEVGEVHHPVDVAGQADEHAELGDVLDLAFDLGADRVLLLEVLPRIGETLFEAERNTALLRVDVEHHHLDLLAGRDDLAGVHVLLGPAHFRNMDQAFDAGLELDEGAIVGDVGDTTLEARGCRVFELDALPRVGLELLHAERDALRLGIEADDLHLDGLADIQRLGRMVDAAPGDVGDVEETVDAAQ